MPLILSQEWNPTLLHFLLHAKGGSTEAARSCNARPHRGKLPMEPMLWVGQHPNPPGSRHVKEERDRITGLLELLDGFSCVGDPAHIGVGFNVRQHKNPYFYHRFLSVSLNGYIPSAHAYGSNREVRSALLSAAFTLVGNQQEFCSLDYRELPPCWWEGKASVVARTCADHESVTPEEFCMCVATRRSNAPQMTRTPNSHPSNPLRITKVPRCSNA